jgi:hypothetical protein
VSSNDEKSYGWVNISSEGVNNHASGGNIAGPDKNYYSTNGACTSLIRKGQSYTTSVNQASDNEKSAYYAFYVWKIGFADTALEEENTADSPAPVADPQPTRAKFDPDKMAASIIKAVRENDEKALSNMLNAILGGKHK